MKTKVFRSTARTVHVVGDLHGDYESFRRAVLRYGQPGDDSLLLFLGDYADRGLRGVEIIEELSGLLDRRTDVKALKGNHEVYTDGVPGFSPSDLVSEAESKYHSWEKFYVDVMRDFVAKLHIAAIVNNALFVHAGISSRIRKAEDLENDENEEVILWSDPSPSEGEAPSLRGAGVMFGQDVTDEVLSSLGLKLLIRSHEPHKAANGPCAEHGGRIVTVNSCASYGEPWRPFLLRLDTRSLKYEPVFL